MRTTEFFIIVFPRKRFCNVEDRFNGFVDKNSIHGDGSWVSCVAIFRVKIRLNVRLQNENIR